MTGCQISGHSLTHCAYGLDRNSPPEIDVLLCLNMELLEGFLLEPPDPIICLNFWADWSKWLFMLFVNCPLYLVLKVIHVVIAYCLSVQWNHTTKHLQCSDAVSAADIEVH